jgi:hypothetical protein
MGNKPHRDPIMTQTCWWLAEILSQMLEPDERAAVLGDFVEAGETGSQALSGILGLVIRRQTVLWAAWRPWLTLVGLIAPLGVLLSIVSRTVANGSAVYVWLYVNNWDWALLRIPGFWRVLADSGALVSLWYLTLVCWSWTGGFALGYASRGLIWINGILLCFMLLLGELVAAPLYFAYCEEYIHRTFRVPAQPDYNSGVTELSFYRVIFPLIVQAVLVAIPALWGLRQGLGAVRLRSLSRTVVWTAAVATLGAMVIQERGLWLLLNPDVLQTIWRPGLWLGRGLRLLQFVVYWPIVYLAARAIRRRWHHRDRPDVAELKEKTT